MDVTIVNKSMWSDESLQAIVDFLTPCYADVGMPVRLTFRSKRGRGTWGKAYFPVSFYRRVIKPGEYAAVVNIGDIVRPEYPISWTYKKASGPETAYSLVEELVHTVAHELRHLEQFEAARLAREGLKKRPQTVTTTSGPGGSIFPSIVPSTAALLLAAPFSRWFRQYEKAEYSYGSCEVDAEVVAHSLLKAYRVFIRNSRKRAA